MIKVKDITTRLLNMDQEKQIRFDVDGTHWDFFYVKIMEDEYSVRFELDGEWSDDENPQDILGER